MTHVAVPTPIVDWLSTELFRKYSSTIRDHEIVSFSPNRSEHIYVLLNGYATRFVVLDDGRRIFLSLHFPGDIVNWDMILSPKAPYAILALKPCSVLRIPRQDMLALLASDPKAMQNFRQEIAHSNLDLVDRLVSLGRRSGVERTAHFIYEFKLGAQSRGDRSSELPFKQDELADFLGISVVTVNRTIQELRDRRLIKGRGKKIVVTDMAKLREVAQLVDPPEATDFMRPAASIGA